MKQFKSILLIKLPYCPHPDVSIEDDDFRTKAPFRPIPSLALASLCAFVDKYKTFDYNLKAIDVNIEAYTQPENPIDANVFSSILADSIKNNTYDVLALSAMFVFNVRWLDMAVKLSRKFHPEAKIIIGGGCPTIFPERCLKDYDIDDAVIGEGESAFLHILNRYNNHHDPEFERAFPLEGFLFKGQKEEFDISKQRHHFIDLTDFPLPAWHYLNVEKYFMRSGDRMLPIEGSRGCPYRCTYCSTYISWGHKVRYKPVKVLINEITEINKRYGVKGLHFVDDNLSFSKRWIKEFLTQLISMNQPLKFTASNFSAKHLDEEIVGLLAAAGMTVFGVAVESGSAEIQERIKKNVDFDKVREVVKIMKSHNLHVHLCWMVGFPNETMEQINSTFNLARELRANSNQFMRVLPYPGTQLFDEAKSANLLALHEDDLDKFDNRKCEYLKSDEWGYKQLQEMIYDVNIEINFLNNPLLDSEEGRDYMLEFFERLLLRLPEHAIARIIVGYIYKKKGDLVKCEKNYISALDLLQKESIRAVFNKYLLNNHHIVNDFNQFRESKNK